MNIHDLRSATNPSRKSPMNLMRKLISFSALAIALVGCVEPSPDVNRVQTNLVDKSIFEGEWWTLQTVVDADGDATAAGAAATVYAYPGGSGFTDLALDSGQSAAIGRIRWVIDQDFLYAYRAYELIDGGNRDGREGGFRGQPLAAFRIEGHVDIRNSYNTFTGEVTNVTEENTTDRRWFERQYMRVDWSQNVSNSFAYLEDQVELGRFSRESAPFFFPEEGAFDEFPRSYAPQFVRVGQDPGYRWASEWPEGTEDTVHYMSFTSMMMFSPGGSCFLIGGGLCQTVALPVRTAFLRVPPDHEYATAQQSYESFDRFGTFRTFQRTYVRGGDDTSVLRERCESDSDCGSGGFCDLDNNWCAGGLTSDFGELDFLTFYRPRHNFTSNSLTDVDCRSDWECNGLYNDDEGMPVGVGAGSVCDRAARRCTVPMAERMSDDNFRQVTYHLNDGFPRFMVRDAFDVVGEWNEVFMRGRRVTTGEALPTYDTPANSFAPQSVNPTEYCYVGSPDVRDDGTCKGQYDPFQPPSYYAGRGVESPYDCQIVNVAGFAEPDSPTSFTEDYPLPDAYRYEFQGTECAFLLKTNACDWWRDDASVACDDVTNDDGALVRWEQQGDIRYQFFNYIEQVGTLFGGISEIRVDPTTGEIITADANYAGAITENMTFIANEWFPVLRCLGDAGCAPGEEGSDERWTAGGPIREYFQNLGRVELPRSLAPSGTDGIGVDDTTRPVFERPASADDRMAAARANIMSRAAELEPLMNDETEGFERLGARLRRLEGTDLEARLMAPMGRTGMAGFFGRDGAAQLYGNSALVGGTTDVSPTANILDEDVLDRISPFRGNEYLRTINAQRDLEMKLGEMGADFMDYTDVFSFLRSRYWEYYAETFRGRPKAEAAIRIAQMFMRNVQRHEMGHSVGLRHNFAGSVDRDQFGDGYFNLLFNGDESARLPSRGEYDDNGDGTVGAQELNRYYEDLRDARNRRAELGAHNYMTASIMDYNGDLSDSYGLGKYDIAAVMWSHFDQVEAYTADPIFESTDADSRNGIRQSHITPRTWYPAYEGGQSCNTNSDCPFNQDRIGDAPIWQRCVQNPRNERNPSVTNPCTDGDSQACICTSFDNDFDEYILGEDDASTRAATGYTAYDPDPESGDGISRLARAYPVRYQFCSDRRSIDLSWCTRQDAGESFQEAIDHFKRSFYERYAGSAYRRFRPGGARTGTSIGSIFEMAKIFQHLYFRLFFEPGFRENSGPLGFDDQLNASLDGMNFMMELVNLPDEGSYELNPVTGNYRQVDDALDMPGTDFSLAPGQGFGLWTQYQEGHQGYFRAERGGVFFDKWIAMLGLVLRNWGGSFTIDERFNINFYNQWPDEITEFFGGIILDEPTWFAPRVTFDAAGDPVITHMTFDRGFRFRNGLFDVDLPPQPEQYPEPALEDTTNEILRSWASVVSLALIPTFAGSVSNPVFEQTLQVFKLDDGNGFEISDVQPNGDQACAYGPFAVDAAHLVVDPDVDDKCDTAEDASYVVYNSENLSTPYVAVKVRNQIVSVNREETNLGFQLLRGMVDLQKQIADYEAAGQDDLALEARTRLQADESYVEYLIDLQARFGIAFFG
ncbi:MAG: hypothetical protein AAF447_17200 [Myxococcota bacterium]